MNLFKFAVTIILAESTILSRNKRDSIGQNRLGNNLHFHKVGKDRRSMSPNYSFQLLEWLKDSKDLKNILKRTKMSSSQVFNRGRSHRFQNFRRHHRSV